MAFAQKDNSLIITNGKLAENCGCCGWYCYDDRDWCCRCNYESPFTISVTIDAPDFPLSPSFQYFEPPQGATDPGLYVLDGGASWSQVPYGTFNYPVSDFKSSLPGSVLFPDESLCGYYTIYQGFRHNGVVQDFFQTNASNEGNLVSMTFDRGGVRSYPFDFYGLGAPQIIPGRPFGAIRVVAKSANMFPGFSFDSWVFRIWELANLTGQHECDLSKWTWTHQGSLFKVGPRVVYSWIGLANISVTVQ